MCIMTILCLQGVLGLADLSIVILDRLIHFVAANELADAVTTGTPYDRNAAIKILEAAIDDYKDHVREKNLHSPIQGT